VNQDFPIKHAGHGFLAQITLAFILLRPGFYIKPSLTVDGEVAHAGGWLAVATAIDPLGVLATSHLHAVWRAGKLHALNGARIHILQCDTAPADQIG